MAAPILTLTTDFGLSDHYVGAMKGVILGIVPEARIVDISHQTGAYAIADGAFLIAEAYGCFPRGAVHVVVVDPGVGTERRAIVAEAAGQLFVAPDNGVLGMVFAREKHKVREVVNARYFRQPVRRTFHGRDIFAPVGAHLARGIPVARMGGRIEDYARGDFAGPRRGAAGVWEGRVLHVDRFGNLVTNFRAEEFPCVAAGSFTLTAGRRRTAKAAANYAEGSGLFAIVGSGGYVELSAKQQSAAQLTGCRLGSVVKLRVPR